MSTTINPTVGRIVWYRHEDGAIRSAIVAGVNSPSSLNLFVFGYSSSDLVGGMKDSVKHADPDVEPGCYPSWHWMPYQIDQAKKAEDREHDAKQLVAAADRASDDRRMRAGILDMALRTPGLLNHNDVLKAAAAYQKHIAGEQASAAESKAYVNQSDFVTKSAFTGLSFGDALVALKGGAKVARAGWNGKGMWLILVPGTPCAELREGTPYAKALQAPACEILPHIDMWTVNAEGRRAMLPGWLASQSDMLAEDWLIVD